VTKSKYLGKGVLKAVANANTEIAKIIAGLDAADQRALDHKMIALRWHAHQVPPGGQRHPRRFHGRRPRRRHRPQTAALQISFALFHGFVANLLPCPMMNILNGGAHADSSVDFQEFMVMPVGAPNFSEALRWGVEIFTR